jgi:lipid-A-disaccharide synthase
MLRIGIVAGETSGDLLASGLIRALREHYPDAVFEGIAGPRMQAAGARSLYPMERLSVMGLFEVLGRYRELARMRRDLIRHFCDHPPDLFIGVDAPDFNHVIETRLKARGIRTIHYVSPSVWAWRRYRLRKLKRAVDLMLTLFPFEARFYEEHDIPVRFVGHPLADMIPLQPDVQAARQAFGLESADKVLAILPGSRVSEVSRLADDFIQAAQNCVDKSPGLKLLVPLVNDRTRGVFQAALQRHAPELPVILVDGRSREVMTAADVVLLASGTAALEAMLLAKPMVVAYRLSPLTYQLARFLVKVDVYSLPNLLAGEKLVPEIIQHEVTPARLSAAVLEYFNSPQDSADLRRRFTEIHRTLQQDASASAAQAIEELLATPE